MIKKSLLLAIVFALVGCQATVQVAPLVTPEEPPAQEARGLVFLHEGQVHLWSDGEYRVLGSLPDGAGHLAMGKYYLAYTHGGQIEALSLALGTVHRLHQARERPGQDWDLLWGGDGLVLAYALAWDEPDGSRVVEIGDVVADALRRYALGMVARPAGPTPTPPPAPGHPPAPGFANLALLGVDERSGLLAVTPVGGAERYAAVWLYDLDDHRRVQESSLSDPQEIVQLAASADLRWLAVSSASGEEGLVTLHPLWAHPGDEPVPQESRILGRHAGQHVTDLAWSLDGRHLAYVLREGLPSLDVSPALGLEVLDVTTGELRSLPLEAAAEIPLLEGWTGDGHAMVLHVVGRQPEDHGATLVDAATGETVRIPLPPGARPLGWLGESPGSLQG